tara:strand:- start:225 stop:464 length:240 start_codon:yes stop_codon:yes gene_type:complete
VTKYLWWNNQWTSAETLKKDRTDSGPFVISDIDEYRAIGLPGAPMIGSRSQHRAELRRHNMIEIGNERPKNFGNINRQK